VHVQCRLLLADRDYDECGLFGLPNEQRATNTGVHVLPLQCELLLPDYSHNNPVVLGLSNEQCPTNNRLYCLCGQRWQLLPDIDRDDCGLHSVSWRHV